MEFCDYIIFADESGDHGLDSIDPQFPVFSLVFCVFHKDEYRQVIEPAVRAFKFKHFGHDAVVLHEREIRKQMKPFDFLRTDPAIRIRFFDDLTDLMKGVKMRWFAQVINKEKHKSKYKNPWNPYEVAMRFGLEKLCSYMAISGQKGRHLHVLFESRGHTEDAALELEFHRVTSGHGQFGWKRIDFGICKFEPVFVSKHANLAGHQIADLIARPLALRALRPDQPNRAIDAVWSAIGDFKVFP